MECPPLPTSLLELDGIRKTYPGASPLTWALSLGRANRRPVEALRGVTLEVKTGEVVGLLGPNGSGKSTLMRCAAGLLSPSSGTVRVMGENPAGLRTELRGRIGLVSRDARSFNFRLSGEQNLSFYGRLQGLGGADLKSAVDRVLDQVQLSPWRSRPFRSYSSGMRQRLSLARALLNRPQLLLMDEATSGLDPGKRDRFYALLGRLVERESLGILYTTHDLREAQYLCKRVVLLDEGRIVSRGDYLDVEPIAESVFRRHAGAEMG